MTSKLFGGCYHKTRVLVTGNTGFKGSWLSFWLKQMGAHVSGCSIGIVSDPSHFSLLGVDYESSFIDIRNKTALSDLIQDINPEIIFHLAAQSLVGKSYADPILTYETNLLGTLNLFEAVRQSESVKVIVNVTTDKVYENLNSGVRFSEGDQLGGHDPYSSSKACVEILSKSYQRSFLESNGIAIATARAGNVVGGGDWATDRLIPDLIRSLEKDTIIKIRNPDSIRPWQHVLDPLSGYLLLGQRLLEHQLDFSGSWNFGPTESSCVKVKEVLQLANTIWGTNAKITFENGQFHEADLLKLDCTKAIEKLGWRSIWDLETTIIRVMNWYKKYYKNQSISTGEDLEQYLDDATVSGVSWA